ncbi:hypothetical protein ACWIUD_01630 [Helicobacter sp. 23-1044]
MKILIFVAVVWTHLFGAWVMFNDGEDTYIYNNISGDIFIRHRGEGKNYEDKFIKMPAGEIPPNLKNSQNPPKDSAKKSQNSSTNSYNNTQQPIQKEQVDAMRMRFQELESNLLNKALE